MNINNNSNKGGGKVENFKESALVKQKAGFWAVERMGITKWKKGIKSSNPQGEQSPSGQRRDVHKQSTKQSRFKISFPPFIHILSTTTRFDQITGGGYEI